MADQDEQKPVVVQLPIDWQIPPGVHTTYATNVVVQHTDEEFTISFFELRAPLFLGDDAKIQELRNTTKSVPAVCVARIILSPQRMEQTIDVLKRNFDKYKAKIGSKTSEKGPNGTGT